MKKNYQNALVSIAVITYNQQDYIEECINSCLAQDYDNFEIIVADDGSLDSTPTIIKELCEKYPNKIKRYLSDRNRGLVANCNLAWMNCSGEWIKTIAGDDKLYKNCISSFMNQVKKKECDILFCRVAYFFNDKITSYKKPWLKFFSLKESSSQLDLLSLTNGLSAPAAFMKRSVLMRVGYADTNYSMIEDYPLWVKFCKINAIFSYTNEPLVMYRIGDTLSQSRNKIGHLQFIESLHRFRVDILWPMIPIHMKFKIIDDYIEYKVKKYGIRYLNNNKSHVYNFFYLATLIIRPYSVYVMLRNKI